jgi:hypothetical protein
MLLMGNASSKFYRPVLQIDIFEQQQLTAVLHEVKQLTN